MSVDLSLDFKVPGKVIYETLLSGQEMGKVCRDPSVSRNGKSMRLYGGAIEMDNIEEDSEKMVIKMNFKEKTWSSSSQVTISFKDDDSENTTLRLEQSNVPSGNAPQMKQQWINMIFRPMSQILGFPMENNF